MNHSPTENNHQDYQRVARAISYLQTHVHEQPSLDQIAAHVHLSPHHFQRLFSRWAGVSPKKFLEALTLTEAKTRLRASLTPLLELSEDLGLGSSSRLHDHFVQLEGMTPAQYRQRGEGMVLVYGLAPSTFGDAWVAGTERGICQLWFADLMAEVDFIEALRREWPRATLVRDDAQAGAWIGRIFRFDSAPDRPLSLLVRGTNFQMNVWNALLRIPFGSCTSYAEIAKVVGKPDAVRAVGSAVGANPVAFVIPCHRVIRADGGMGGYRGGLVRKQAMLAWERLQDEIRP